MTFWRLVGCIVVGLPAMAIIGPVGCFIGACVAGIYFGFKDVSADRVKAAEQHQKMYAMLHEHERADFSGALHKRR